jgi:hypothetical protein
MKAKIMFNKLSAHLTRLANGWLVLVLLLMVVLISQIIIDPFTARLEALSGGSGLIDMLLTYSPETAFGLIESYGEAGRTAYSYFTATGDVIFPVAYGLFLSLLLSWLLLRGTSPDSRLRLLNLVPMAAWAFDWLENVMILTMLGQYPNQSLLLAGASSLATSAKWAMSAVTFLALVAALVLLAKAKLQSR